MRHDVTFPLYVEVDAIFNLACPASPIHYQRDPVQTTKTSVHGAINMLGLAKRLGARIFQASTSEVYGDPLIHPQPRITGATSIRSASAPATTKASAAPKPCSSITGGSTQLPIKVARIFNTYGPRMQPNDGRVVSSFIVQALKGEPITVFGDGGQTRSFCYVDDLVEAITRLMLTDEACTGPINLGNNSEFTILELAEKVISYTGSRSKLIFKPLPQDDPRQRQPDLSKAKAHLNWEPKVALADGLKETIAYFKHSLELADRAADASIGCARLDGCRRSDGRRRWRTCVRMHDKGKTFGDGAPANNVA